MTLIEKLNETKTFLQNQTSTFPQIALTLGSGLAGFVESMEIETTIPYSDIPHFAPPKVKGHPGRLVLGRVNNTPLAVLQGRIHFYEGHSLESVTFPTRSLIYSGAQHFIITNAAGGMGDDMSPGHLMVIQDQINLTGQNPLIGPNEEALGPRFPDMTNLYCEESRQKLLEVLKKFSGSYSEGVYCGVSGPTYETAAEIQFMKTIGASAVGMSTVPEVIVARHMGAKVTGMSCITNLCTGISQTPLSHDEVKDVAKKVEKEFCQVLIDFIPQIGTN